MSDSVRSLDRRLKRPKVTTRQILDVHVRRIGNIVTSFLVEFAGLGLAIIAFQYQDGTFPGTQQRAPSSEPFLPEGRRIEVPWHSTNNSRIGKFLDDPSHHFVRDRSLCDPGVHPHHKSLRVLHCSGPGGISEDGFLGCQDRVEMVEMLLATSITQHALWVFCGDEVGLNGPTIMADDVEACHADLLKHCVELVGHTFVAVITRRLL